MTRPKKTARELRAEAIEIVRSSARQRDRDGDPEGAGVLRDIADQIGRIRLTKADDPRTGRPFGDHGPTEAALAFALDATKHDGDTSNQVAFLSAWSEGSAFKEWPEFYTWLADWERGR